MEPAPTLGQRRHTAAPLPLHDGPTRPAQQARGEPRFRRSVSGLRLPNPFVLHSPDSLARRLARTELCTEAQSCSGPALPNW